MFTMDVKQQCNVNVDLAGYEIFHAKVLAISDKGGIYVYHTSTRIVIPKIVLHG